MDSDLPATTKPALGKKIWNFPLTRMMVGVLLILAAVIIGQIMVVMTGRWIFAGKDLPEVWKMLGFLVTTILAILSYVFHVGKIEKRELRELSRSGVLPELGIGCAIGSGLMASAVFVLWIAGYYQVTGVGSVLVLFLPFFDAVFAGFFEELLFRGIIFRIINNSLGSWPALLLSALIFGFAHAGNPNATLLSSIAIALEAGILLSAVYLFTRRLWMVIGIHFAWNFTLGGIFGIAVSGHQFSGLLQSKLEGPSFLTGGRFGAETSLITVIICLMVGIYFLQKAWQRRHFNRPVWRRGKAAANYL